jgi:magnesium-transporting ATPase (P-type)
MVWQGDPMEVALLESVPADGAISPRLDEIPFDTERKRMSVICDTPQGHMLYCKGAPETVLPLCSAIWQEGGVAPLDEAGRAALRAVQEEMAQRAGAGLPRVAATGRSTRNRNDLCRAGRAHRSAASRRGRSHAYLP